MPLGYTRGVTREGKFVSAYDVGGSQFKISGWSRGRWGVSWKSVGRREKNMVNQAAGDSLHPSPLLVFSWEAVMISSWVLP